MPEFFAHLLESPLTAILVVLLALILSVVSFWISERYATIEEVTHTYEHPDSGIHHWTEEVKTRGPVSCTCFVVGVLSLAFLCFVLLIAWNVISTGIVSALRKLIEAVGDTLVTVTVLIGYIIGAVIVLILVIISLMWVWAFFNDLVRNWPFRPK